MKTLKQLKEALQQWDDTMLDQMFITHAMGVEDGEAKLDVTWIDDEKDWGTYSEKYSEDKVLQQFVRDLNTDWKRCAAAELCDELEEHWINDVPEKNE